MPTGPQKKKQLQRLDAAKKAGFKNTVGGELWDERNLETTLTLEEYYRDRTMSAIHMVVPRHGG